MGAILRTAAALPRGMPSLAGSAEGGTDNAWGGSGSTGVGLSAAGLKPNLKAPASWAARRGLAEEPWVKVVTAPP